MDVAAEVLGDAFHRLGADRDARQLLQISLTFFERLLGSHPSHHAPHARAKGRRRQVQIAVLGNHSAPAIRTVVIGTSHPNRSQDRRQLLVPIALKLRLVPSSAIDPGPLVAASVRTQELLQQEAS